MDDFISFYKPMLAIDIYIIFSQFLSISILSILFKPPWMEAVSDNVTRRLRSM